VQNETFFGQAKFYMVNSKRFYTIKVKRGKEIIINDGENLKISSYTSTVLIKMRLNSIKGPKTHTLIQAQPTGRIRLQNHWGPTLLQPTYHWEFLSFENSQ
jgi:hypothetical protein